MHFSRLSRLPEQPKSLKTEEIAQAFTSRWNFWDISMYKKTRYNRHVPGTVRAISQLFLLISSKFWHEVNRCAILLLTVPSDFLKHVFWPFMAKNAFKKPIFAPFWGQMTITAWVRKSKIRPRWSLLGQNLPLDPFSPKSGSVVVLEFSGLSWRAS